MKLEERQVIASGETKGARRFPTQFLSSGFYSLRVRNFRLFIFGQVVSLTGTWMQTTAQAWLVLQMSNSPLALGFVTTLQFLPVMLLSLYGGVLADRLPKRRTLIITQTLLLIQAAIFGILVGTGTIQLWHLYVLAMAQGIVQAVDVPVRQAFVVEMVGREQLVNAVALNSMTFNGARIIGPALAGFVIANVGMAPALYFNAASYIARHHRTLYDERASALQSGEVDCSGVDLDAPERRAGLHLEHARAVGAGDRAGRDRHFRLQLHRPAAPDFRLRPAHRRGGLRPALVGLWRRPH